MQWYIWTINPAITLAALSEGSLHDPSQIFSGWVTILSQLSLSEDLGYPYTNAVCSDNLLYNHPNHIPNYKIGIDSAQLNAYML